MLNEPHEEGEKHMDTDCHIGLKFTTRPPAFLYSQWKSSHFHHCHGRRCKGCIRGKLHRKMCIGIDEIVSGDTDTYLVYWCLLYMFIFKRVWWSQKWLCVLGSLETSNPSHATSESHSDGVRNRGHVSLESRGAFTNSKRFGHMSWALWLAFPITSMSFFMFLYQSNAMRYWYVFLELFRYCSNNHGV